MPAAVAVVGALEVAGAVGAAGGFGALMAGTASFTLASGLAAVGGVMTTLGALSGDRDLMKIGGVVSLAGGVSALIENIGTTATEVAAEGASESAGSAAESAADAATQAPDVTGAPLESSQSGIINGGMNKTPLGDVTSTADAPFGKVPGLNTPAAPELPQPPSLSEFGAPKPALGEVGSSAEYPFGKVPGGADVTKPMGPESLPVPGKSWIDQMGSYLDNMDEKKLKMMQMAGGALKAGMDYAFPTPEAQAKIDEAKLRRDLWNTQQANGAGSAKIRAVPGIISGARA